MSSPTSDYLDLVILLLQRYVALNGHRMVQASGKLNDLYVSVDEARRLIGRDSDAGDMLPAWTAPRWPTLEEVEAALQPRLEALRSNPGTVGPVDRLRALMTLTEDQLLLVVAAAAPLLSVDLARLFAYAWSDFTLKQPSVGFLTELVGGSSARARALVADFGPGAPIVRNRLVLLSDHGNWGSGTPLLHRLVRVPDAVVAFIAGRVDALSARIASACELTPPDSLSARALLVSDSTRSRLEEAVHRSLASATGEPRLLLIGPERSGRRSLLCNALAEHSEHSEHGVLCADLARLETQTGDFEDALGEVCLEARLRRSVLLLRADRLLAQPDGLDRVEPVLARVLALHRGPLAMTTTGPSASLNRLLGRPVEVHFTLPTSAQQRSAWREALAAVECGESEALAEQLSQRYSLSVGAIRGVVDEAHAACFSALDGARSSGLSVEGIAAAVRARNIHALGQVAQPFSTTLDWDDVVLPEEVLANLQEIADHARLRDKVFDDWGFRRKVSYGRGLSCLFVGPPGTGKTMLAAVLAKSLGRDLYRIDMARISSKWVGETEKNLARIFDEAERAQVILLFDEADSLFATRTEVTSSADRFANMEVNYLLQRMEAYDGMTILTTNFETSIDEAFKRRLRFTVTFPMPGVDQRRLLWGSMLPSQAPVAEGLDMSELAEEFELSDGVIKKAVVRAAFYAAGEDRPITLDDLWDAAVAETREMGMLVRDER